MRAEGDVLPYCFLKKLVFGVLENHSYSETDGADFFRVLPNILSVKQNLPVGWSDKPVEHLHQRTFARACMPDNADKLALIDFKVHIVNSAFFKGRVRAVDKAQIFQLKNTTHLIASSSIATQSACVSGILSNLTPQPRSLKTSSADCGTSKRCFFRSST